jgi:spore germination protein
MYEIHVVQPGDTTKSIAEIYGVSESRLIIENEIINLDNLVIGDTLVILYPEITYTIQDGDTLESIADTFGITVMDLLRNNPYLSNREYIFPGETIVISYKGEKLRKLSVNGYAYPFIDRGILRKTLPFLTYLTIYNYKVMEDSELIDIDDSDLIQLAKVYGTAPLMSISAENTEDARKILNSKALQYRLIDNVLKKLKEKGYYGLNLDAPYLFPQDRELYLEFVEAITIRLNEEGFVVITTINRGTFELLTGILEPGVDFQRLGQIVNGVMLITYELGFTIGVPVGAVSFDTIDKLMAYATTQIPEEKINFGISTIGYIWQLPYEEGVTRGQSITHDAAVALAGEEGVPIQYDVNSQSAYFRYVENYEYIVRFKDARSVDAILELVEKYKLNGIGVWNIMCYFTSMWLIVNAKYYIEKLL